MSLEAIITLTVFALMIVGIIVCATTLHHRCKSTLGHGLPLFAVVGFVLIILQIGALGAMVIYSHISHIPSGTCSVADTELAYSPGSIDPTDVTVDGKTASVDVIQVDTSLKELDQIDKRYWQFAIPVNPI